MFNSVLNFSASTYEAIIAAFVVLSFIASGVIVSKGRTVEWLSGELEATHRQLADTRGEVKKITVSAAKALMAMMTGSLTALGKAELRAKAAEARADAAENEITAIMQAAADRDDEIENNANSPFASGGRADPSAFFFADSHFGVRDPARNDPDDLSRLFAMLDGKGRNGAALDDLIFGRGNSPRHPNIRIMNGGDFIHDGPYSNNLSPGERNITVEDLLSAIGGDVTEIERKAGKRVLEVKVLRADGSEVTGAEREAIVASLGGLGSRSPSFDPLDIDPAAFGTQVHENIEAALNDPHAHGTVAGMGEPDESCSTQQPHQYAASSPRAG